jgi:hypothetical protein
MKLPWRSFRPADKEREYLALLSYLPLSSYLALPLFVWYTLRVGRQLSQTPGVIAYALEAKLLSRQFWTLSIWESEEGLQRFVRFNPHLSAMRSMAPRMGATWFTRYPVTGASLPLSWDDAHEREQKTKSIRQWF